MLQQTYVKAVIHLAKLVKEQVPITVLLVPSNTSHIYKEPKRVVFKIVILINMLIKELNHVLLVIIHAKHAMDHKKLIVIDVQ